MRCSVFGCTTDNQNKSFNKDIMFLRFPTDENVLKGWVKACGRKQPINTRNARICSRHFVASDYVRNLREELLNYKNKNHRMLNKSAIPSKYLPNMPESSSASEKIVGRDEEPNDLNKQFDDSYSNVPSTSSGPLPAISNVVVPSSKRSCKSIGVNTEGENIDELKAKLTELEKYKEAMEKMFTPRQIKKLKSEKHIIWTVEDISEAMVIYAAGPRSYQLLLKKGYPFPSISTLRQWTKEV